MAMLTSSLCDKADAYIPVKGTITAANTGTTWALDNRKKVILENCAAITDCISKINNTQVHNARYINAVVPIYNWIDSSEKTKQRSL